VSQNGVQLFEQGPFTTWIGSPLDDGKGLRRRWDAFFGRRSEVPALPASFPVPSGNRALSFDLEVETLVGEVKVYRL